MGGMGQDGMLPQTGLNMDFHLAVGSPFPKRSDGMTCQTTGTDWVVTLPDNGLSTDCTETHGNCGPQPIVMPDRSG